MLVGPTTTIFLPQPVSEQLLISLDSELRSAAAKIETTRKGREWDLWMAAESNGFSNPIQVHIWDTSERLEDCGADLEELALDSSIFQAFVTVVAGCNESVDWNLVEILAKTIADRFGGIATKPEK
jgi:hypothetical protein